MKKKLIDHLNSVSQKTKQNCLAYQKHLKKNKVKKESFFDLPICDKENYIQEYPLSERMQKGKELADYYMICTSSGSTAEPTIWPRDYEYDQALEAPHTKFLDDHFDFTKKKTLIVIAFGIGTSQAGTMHLKASWEGSVHGKASVISPNADAEQTVFLLENLYKEYDQIITIGYPPIIVDFIDLAIEKKMDLKSWNLKIAFAGEGVGPLWRKDIAKKIGGSNKDIVSFYGSTEAGMIGFESKILNQLITYSLENEDLRFDLFKTFNLPTLVELDFMKKFVEIIDGEVVITADQVIPLVRYNLHDKGKFISSEEIQAVLDKYKINFVFPKNEKILLVYGRNLQRKISIEDLQNAFEILNLDKYFYREFQYEELEKNNSLNLKIIFYSKDGLKVSKENFQKIERKMGKILSKLISSQRPLKVSMKIEKEEKRIGYKSGKLRYFIKK